MFEHQPLGCKLRMNLRDLGALLRSLWRQGVLSAYRAEYWTFLARVLVRYPRKLPAAIVLAIRALQDRAEQQNGPRGQHAVFPESSAIVVHGYSFFNE
ncbi:MAG: DUF4070 domain-containing protein, partial [Gammaproteobacteria bacterium]|nr:DUF4070 domain-containing protein [Gammaproteobacteria bacterium]